MRGVPNTNRPHAEVADPPQALISAIQLLLFKAAWLTLFRTEYKECTSTFKSKKAVSLALALIEDWFLGAADACLRFFGLAGR
jgi:hypothetical protein